MTNTHDEKTLRKFRRERAIGRYLLNPTVKAMGRLGLRTAMATELETTGRKSGQARRVPVSAQFDDARRVGHQSARHPFGLGPKHRRQPEYPYTTRESMAQRRRDVQAR